MNGILEGLDTSSKIKALMATRNLVQYDIALLLGITTETVRQRMNANRWEVNDLKKMADAYGIDVTDLV